MGFIESYGRHKRPNESFILQKKTLSGKDKIGNKKLSWENIQTIYGIMQKKQSQKINESGVKSELEYIGFFIPDFTIETNNFDDYRVKYSNGYETLYLKIKSYDPNLFNSYGERSHYEIEFIQDDKYAND